MLRSGPCSGVVAMSTTAQQLGRQVATTGIGAGAVGLEPQNEPILEHMTVYI
jgi:hypothetical protein